MTITEFLLARIAEDEAVARDATNDGHRWLVEDETISLWPDDFEPAATGNIHFPRKAHAYHAATWEPTRVLAECAAKRQIVELAAFVARIEGYAIDGGYEEAGQAASVPLLRALASVYADHPDYQRATEAGA